MYIYSYAAFQSIKGMSGAPSEQTCRHFKQKLMMEADINKEIVGDNFLATHFTVDKYEKQNNNMSI